jgi:hypothetical protein
LHSTDSTGVRANAFGGTYGAYGENMVLVTNQVSTTTGGFMSLGARNMILTAPNYLSVYTGTSTGSEYRLETGYGIHSATFTHSIVAGLTIEMESYGDLIMVANQPQTVSCPTCGFLSIQGAASAFLTGGSGTTGDVYVQGGRYASLYSTTLTTVTAEGTTSLSAAYLQAYGGSGAVLASPALTSIFGGNSLLARSNIYANIAVTAATGGAALASLSLYANGGAGAFGLQGNDNGAVSASGLTLAGYNTLSLYAAASDGGLYLNSGGLTSILSTGALLASTSSSLVLAATAAAFPLSLYAAGEADLVAANAALAASATLSLTGGSAVYLQAPGTPNTQLRLASGAASLTAATQVLLDIQDAAGVATARLQLGGSDTSSLALYAGGAVSMYGAGGLVGSVSTGAAVSFSGTNFYAGSTSFAVLAASDLLGAVSVNSANTYLGAAAGCSGGSGAGYGCSSGGGQVRVPNSGTVYSSRLYISCASTTAPTPTAAQLMSAHLIIVGNDCPSGTVITLPDMSSFTSTDGWEAVLIYDFKGATFPYLTAPTSSYVTLMWAPASSDPGNMYARVAARTAVTVHMYNSDWGAAAGSAGFATYAVVGATDQGMTTTPKPWAYA